MLCCSSLVVLFIYNKTMLVPSVYTLQSTTLQFSSYSKSTLEFYVKSVRQNQQSNLSWYRILEYNWIIEEKYKYPTKDLREKKRPRSNTEYPPMVIFHCSQGKSLIIPETGGINKTCLPDGCDWKTAAWLDKIYSFFKETLIFPPKGLTFLISGGT